MSLTYQQKDQDFSPVLHYGKTRVLYVDDEEMSCFLIKSMLGHFPIDLYTCNSVNEAKEILTIQGVNTFDCVFSDYNMPFENGICMLKWLKKTDPTISLVMVTAVGDRKVVKEALQEGATDFLDKPINQIDLIDAVEKAKIFTKRSRDLVKTYHAVEKVEKTQEHILRLEELEKNPCLSVFYKPNHRAGGDFLDFFQPDFKRFVLVVADVSGHDLKAAYISAYFKGIVRGMIQGGASIDNTLTYFNRFLTNDWNCLQSGLDSDQFTSVSVAIVEYNFQKSTFYTWSAGLPIPVFIDYTGKKLRLSEPSSPLGWEIEDPYQYSEMKIDKPGHLYIWTDGIEDLCYDANIDLNSIIEMSLSEDSFNDQISKKLDLISEKASDDMLIVKVNLDPDNTDLNKHQLIFENIYRSSDLSKIEMFVKKWNNCLTSNIINLSEDKAYDILLGSREVFLNGLKHGCKSNKFSKCIMQFWYNHEKRLLKLIFDDPGVGFDDSFLKNQDQGDIDHINAGLILIKAVSDNILTRNNGSSITLEFNV